MRFENMEAYNTWQAERQAGLKPPPPPGSTLQEDKADSGPESILSGKVVKYCDEHGFTCQCFRKSRKAIAFLVPGLPD